MQILLRFALAQGQVMLFAIEKALVRREVAVNMSGKFFGSLLSVHLRSLLLPIALALFRLPIGHKRRVKFIINLLLFHFYYISIPYFFITLLFLFFIDFAHQIHSLILNPFLLFKFRSLSYQFST
jgi:hypothetical protein